MARQGQNNWAHTPRHLSLECCKSPGAKPMRTSFRHKDRLALQRLAHPFFFFLPVIFPPILFLYAFGPLSPSCGEEGRVRDDEPVTMSNCLLRLAEWHGCAGLTGLPTRNGRVGEARWVSNREIEDPRGHADLPAYPIVPTTRPGLTFVDVAVFTGGPRRPPPCRPTAPCVGRCCEQRVHRLAGCLFWLLLILCSIDAVGADIFCLAGWLS